MIEKVGARCEVRSAKVFALITFCVAVSFVSLAFPQTAWQLIDTKPFAGKAKGVVGALGVPTRGLTKTQVRIYGRQRALEWDARLKRTKPRLIEWLIKQGYWKQGQRLGVDAIIVAADSISSRSRQSYGAGNLQFRFENFPSAVEAKIRDFLDRAIPVLVEVYGPPITSPPGSTRTVTIVLDEALDALDGGVYNAAADEIRLPEFVPQRGYDWFNLLHQLLHAFRGPLMLSFPSWEEGQARAAAMIAAIRLRGQGVAELSKFDPKDPVHGDPLWVLPLYDILNQPPLGNPVFLPPSGFQPMAFWRIAMSASAWLKVAAENSQCFRLFNAALLSLPDPMAVRGDTIALVDLMREIVPRVEGMDFYDWYRRQYVLDTGVSVGPKLYAFAVPLHIGILLILNHYRTSADGDEFPLNGIAQLVYRNDLTDDLYAEEGNEAEIYDGEGFIAPQFFNIGGANLVFIDIFVNGLALTVPFPYMVRGEEPNENPIWGGVLNALSGQIQIRFNDLTDLQPVNVTRGVFAVTQGLDIYQLYRLRVRHVDEGSEAVEYRNAAFDIYCLIVQARPSVITMEVTLPAGIHLFSVPLLPTSFDEAEALGISPDELLLARWNPLRPGELKYEFYPRITTPMMPGVGYWLKLLRETTIRVEGTPVPSDQPYQIPLYGGFNQVGNPFARDLPVGEILVAFGNEGPVGLAEAERRAWVQNAIWVWDKVQGYQLAQTIRPWQGFWVRALRPSGVRLVFNWSRTKGAGRGAGERSRLAQIQPTSVGTLSSNSSLVPRPSSPVPILWSVRLIVTAPNSPSDTENRFGIASGSQLPSRIFKPPMVPNSVWAAFVCEGTRDTGQGTGEVELVAHDIRPEGSSRKWRFIVKSDLPDNTPVTLRWEGLAQLPRTISLIVTDLTTKERLSLRSRSSYTFIAQRGETRQFLIEAVQSSSAPLVRIVSVQSLRGRGLTARLVLTVPAQVRSEIRTLTGRTIRILTDTFVAQPSPFNLLWDGRDRTGTPLPFGAYLLVVNARDEFGREQQVIRTVMLR
ncbi:MAG: hypothetical protein LM632_02845 [Armatimonadetes bacterium]|nr:hypothetical protein [Armatimonadota bacterium]